MLLKETVAAKLKDKYTFLECDTSDELQLITVGTEEEPYALNIELQGNDIFVNIIDKDKRSIIDNYDDVVETDDAMNTFIDTAIATYESIVAAKPQVEAKLNENKYRETADEATFYLNNIITECKNYIDTFTRNYDNSDEDEGFNNYAKTLENIKEEVRRGYETVGIKPVTEVRKCAESESVDSKQLSILEMLQECCNAIRSIPSEDDELQQRMFEDLSLDVEKVMTELEYLIPKGESDI